MTDPYDDTPADLPEVDKAAKKSSDPLGRSRVCPTCGKEARIVSNHNGVRGFCGPCKQDWGISLSRAQVLPIAADRGLSRQVQVQPDWDMAYAFDDEDDEYNKNGE